MRMDSGMILGWKFNNAPGIKTIDGLIVEWPSSLGAMPTDAQIAAWGEEYDAAMAAASQAEQNRIERKRADIAAELPAWATLRDEMAALIDAMQAATTITGLRKATVDWAQYIKGKMKILYWTAKDTGE